MAAVLFVVGNLTLDAEDSAFNTHLTSSRGDTVTTILDTTAEASTASYDYAVVSPSCSSVNLGAKYLAWAKPVLLFEGYAVDGGTTEDWADGDPTTGSVTNIYYLSNAEVAWTGQSANSSVSIYSSSYNVYRLNRTFGAGFVTVAQWSSVTTDVVAGVYPSGSTVQGGDTANANYALFSLGPNSLSQLNTAGLQLVDDLIDWMVAGSTSTVSVSGTGATPTLLGGGVLVPAGDEGEFYDTGLTVQLGFGYGALSTSVVWHTVPNQYVLDIDASTCSKTRFSDSFAPGDATVTLDMDDREYDPTYSGSSFANQFQWGTQIRIAAPGPVFLWRGFVRRWEPTVATHQARCVIAASDMLELPSYKNLTGTRVSESVDDRVGYALDQTGWDSTLRTIDQSNAELDAATFTSQTSATSTFVDAARSDGGIVYYDPNDGHMHFESRDGIATRTRIGTSQRTFSTAGTDIVDGTLRLSAVGDEYRNTVRVTRGDGTVTSAGSVPTGQAERAVTRVVALTGPEMAESLTSYLADLFDTEEPGPRQWAVDAMLGDTDLAVSAVGATRLRDRVTLSYDPPGAGSVTTEVIVTGIQHRANQTRWRATFQAEPAAQYDNLDGPPSTWLIWDSSAWDSSTWSY